FATSTGPISVSALRHWRRVRRMRTTECVRKTIQPIDASNHKRHAQASTPRAIANATATTRSLTLTLARGVGVVAVATVLVTAIDLSTTGTSDLAIETTALGSTTLDRAGVNAATTGTSDDTTIAASQRNRRGAPRCAATRSPATHAIAISADTSIDHAIQSVIARSLRLGRAERRGRRGVGGAWLCRRCDRSRAGPGAARVIRRTWCRG